MQCTKRWEHEWFHLRLGDAVEYNGIAKEHTAVRTAAGYFDVSHMGECEIRGPEALDLVHTITTNDAAK
jgi:aminomethyltransferase